MLGRHHQSLNRAPSSGYGYGGQPAQYQSYQGPPPGADPQLWQWFSSVDTDRSGAISATELQAALVNGTCSQRATQAYMRAYTHAGSVAGDWSRALIIFLTIIHEIDEDRISRL